MRHLKGKWTLSLALALLMASSISGCRFIGSLEPSPQIPLRIGIVADSPPLIFRLNGKWAGLEADLGRILAERLGMKPVFMAFPPPQLSTALLEGKVDILMAGITISEERRVQMDFSIPYLVVGQAALVRTSDLQQFNTEIKIRATSQRVGVLSDSSGDQLVSSFFSNANRVPFPTIKEATDSLLKNRIDMIIYDAPAAWWLALAHEEQLSIAPALFAREELAWGVRRESIGLRSSANQALKDWQKDGTLESILQRWIPYSK